MFKDFAIYGINPSNGAPLTDPAISYVRNGSDQTSGGVGNPWTRPYVTFVPDRDASYLGVGARISGLNLATIGQEQNNAQYLTKWQLERAKSNGLPTTYGPAREVQIIVKPDLLNLVPNPTAAVNVAGYNSGANTTLTRSTSWRADGVLNLAVTATGSNDSSINIGGDTGGIRLSMAPSTTYTISADINTPVAQVGTVSPTRSRRIVVFTRSGADPYVEWRSEQGPATGEARLSLTFTTPANLTEAFVRLYNGSGTAGDVVQWDNILLHKGEVAKPYFDGSFGDDYLWEGTAHNSRSYYYENRLDRVEAIRRALRDSVPLGIGVAEPKFAVWTE